MKRIRLETLTTAQTLILGYLIFITIGAILLTLPISSEGDERLPFIDSIFMAASAISGSGLFVVDMGQFFSFFGEVVILLLIQIGNVGYMLFFALAVLVIGKRLSLINKLLIKNSISLSKLDLKMFVFKVFKYTLVIQGVTALLLFMQFVTEFPVGEAIYRAIFISISAFCTAGFSMFTDSLSRYSENYYVVFIVILASYLGSCGFFVLHDLSGKINAIKNKKRNYQLSTHTKVVLTVSIGIIVIGQIFIYFSELILNPTNISDTFLTSLFQSASASTSVGFNTVDIAKLNNSSLMFLMIEMFIGASPSGTGGGIKTTVFAIMVLSLFTFIRDRKYVNTLHRSIHPTMIAKAFSISFLALIWLTISVLILSLTESVDFVFVWFEAVSALGNNGLSTGVTPHLSTPGKIVITLLMLIGRVGPLLVGYSLIGKQKPVNYQYPEANILIV